ncbi:SAM-dependent methyltransferase [Actinoplanes sp. NPDC049599]|uniref:SAM-dependent methyltransferase n=1 Tax=Actinoplanes sp. NPDC049599 TaxID=3363903 RepID=UPI00379CC430
MTDLQPGGGDTMDIDTPNVARVWDYQLGGKDNFQVDRVAAEQLNQVCRAANAPTGCEVARENRAFIRRAVTYLARQGIDQFIDLGAGLPTRGNVHEVAQAVNPWARTVYVDYDALVAVHGRALLADNPETVMVRADVRQPDSVLGNSQLRSHIDLGRPVAVLMVALLHLFTADEAPAGIVARFRDALAVGSYVVITHVSGDSRPEAAGVLAAEFTRLGVTTPLVPRTAAQIGGFFDGLELVEPGLVSPARWRPDPADVDPGEDTRWMWAGVARLPAR